MTQFGRAPARLGGRSGRGVALVTVVLTAGALACSESSPSNPNPAGAGGSAGQSPVGTAGNTVTAGSASPPTAGTSSASGAAGTASGGGGAAGEGGVAGTGGAAGTGGSAGGTAGASGGGGRGGAGGGGSGGVGGADDGWVSLFNGTNLDGWTVSPGSGALFAVTQLDGGGVIHVYPTQADQSQQGQAALRTNASYKSYIYHEEYKWGTKRFSDRKQTARDNGVVFHICNDPTKVWPDSVEFQLGEDAWGNDWVTGNIFMLVNKTRAQWPSTTIMGKKAFSDAAGTPKANLGAPASYALGLSSSQENKAGVWNTIELTVHGSTDAEYKVNGVVVNRVFDMECDEGQGFKPLDHGPIAVQAEFAEVYFRNIKIKVLP